jgi:hypothetical protein
MLTRQFASAANHLIVLGAEEILDCFGPANK